jgi:hypothetical protein
VVSFFFFFLTKYNYKYSEFCNIILHLPNILFVFAHVKAPLIINVGLPGSHEITLARGIDKTARG